MAQENPNIDTVAEQKAALITDLNPSFVGKDQYSHARNVVKNSKGGDIGTIGNEPSNTLCITTPYRIIGTIPLPDDRLLIFSTDNSTSEIGIGNPKDCSYTTISNLACLAFSLDYPITGVAKKLFHQDTVVTFTDKKNPIRRITLKDPSKWTCENTLLFKKIQQPCLTIKKGHSGTLPNGSYSVVIAYIVDETIYTDYFSITNRLQIYTETSNNSLEIKLDGLDKQFDKFALIVIGNYVDPVTKGATKIAKNVGLFSTKTKSISLSDFTNASYQEVSLSTLVVKKKSWLKAGIISSNSNYLLLGDLVGREEENYQLKAMSIKADYVIDQVLADYYEDGGEDIGYYADENYDFYIQGVYSTGEYTDKFHIPGRLSDNKDREIVSSADVYEHDTQFADCTTEKVYRWQVENTAGDMVPQDNKFLCNRRELGIGKMGYFESTEVYPDNKDMYGEWANLPIRYHKFPDEEKVPRYTIIDGKTYINIKGIRFKNIPAFDNPDITGYKITRSDRRGGNGTVIARGIMTNVRSYDDPKLKQTILYSNYTVNDLNPDMYLSSTQAQFKNGTEHDFTPLVDYHKDQFTFHSPHTHFEPKYTLGTEVKIEAEEVAVVTGSFEKVYKHPRQKLLNQFSFWLAAALGIVETKFEEEGLKTKTTADTTMKGKAGINITATGTASFVTTPGISDINFGKSLTNPFGGVTSKTEGHNGGSLLSIMGETTKSAIADLGVIISSGDFSKIKTYLKVLKDILKIVASAGLEAGLFAVSAMRYATEYLDIIYNFTGYTDYTYQYNAKAVFNQSIPSKSGNKRRRLLKPAYYIPSDVVTIDDKIFNNYGRERSVYFKLNKEISDPKTIDTSRGTMSSFGLCGDATQHTSSTGSAFYVTSKISNPNQYGEVGSATPVSMHSCVLTGDTTPTLFGGDCIISRFQFQKKMHFFNQNLANANYPDGTEYDYRLYRNIAYPRYWIDSTKYDFSNLLTKTVVNYSTFSRTTAGKYNLDCKNKDVQSITRVEGNMYLSNNCAMDFFVESDFNPSFREKTTYPFYSKNNTNLSQIFRSDRLTFEEEFVVNRVYVDTYTTEIYARQQRDWFDPKDPIPAAQPNSVIYSLPSYNLQEIDNWQYFLPANYFAFKESDFGQLTTIQKLDQDRILFLFSKSSPYISMGRDFIQLENSGRKITIGDGGLFAQDPREIMPTDNNYGASNSRYAFSNTHLGRYYVSERQGRILQFNENVDDISRQGVSYWCKNYMPIFLYKYFPTYPEVENPINGVGYLSVFDSFNETVYITKRDFSPKKEYAADITYNNGFFYKGLSISLHSAYFNDISWTLSYSPIDKGFISWHDWHPEGVIQTDNHFMTIKDNGIWKHNESTDSFCNFYGKDYPFEIEFVSASGQQVETIRSLEYILEVYKYKNFGRDRFHILNENFDKLIVSNTEQISPLLNLIHGNPNAEENLIYPRKSTNLSYDIAFFKEQNKYRLNQFWDTTKDRGEYSGAEVHLFPTDESGYKNIINPVAINIDKPEEERKKFRHYWNKFRLIKTISGANKFITKIFNIKKQIV